MKNKKLRFGDVISQETPNTEEKVFERWKYLQSEYLKEDNKDAYKTSGMILIILIVMILASCLI